MAKRPDPLPAVPYSLPFRCAWVLRAFPGVPRHRDTRTGGRAEAAGNGAGVGHARGRPRGFGQNRPSHHPVNRGVITVEICTGAVATALGSPRRLMVWPVKDLGGGGASGNVPLSSHGRSEARAGRSSFGSQPAHADGRHVVSDPARDSRRYGSTATPALILNQAHLGRGCRRGATGTMRASRPGRAKEGCGYSFRRR
jgi:hypothetical protein